MHKKRTIGGCKPKTTWKFEKSLIIIAIFSLIAAFVFQLNFLNAFTRQKYFYWSYNKRMQYSAFNNFT